MPVAVTLYSPEPSLEVHEPDPAPTAVPELAVQLAWVRGQIGSGTLRTTDGAPVDVIRWGTLNRDSGPDIRDAAVRIGDLLWAGDIEVHRTSADWRRHGHDGDAAYDRVVLHVILAADGETGAVLRSDGSRVPEVIVLPHVTVSLARLVCEVHEPADGPPCAIRSRVLPAAPDGWLSGLGSARIHSRADDLAETYRALPDLAEMLARRVFRALGYEANAHAMETLATRLDLGIVRRLPDQTARLAWMLTAAGLDTTGLFRIDAAEVAPMPRESWRRGGRPANAPRTRIAQAARLLAPGRLLSRDGLALSHDVPDLGALIDWLRAPADDTAPRLGAARARDVVMNAVLPIWVLDGEQREDPTVSERVARFAQTMPAASDRVVRAYHDAGLEARTALDAQGIHHLAATLCAEGRCARCAVGVAMAPGLAG